MWILANNAYLFTENDITNDRVC